MSRPTTENSAPYITNRRFFKLNSCALSFEDLKRLHTIISEKVFEAIELELPKPPPTFEERYREDLHKVRSSLRLVVNIVGTKGERIMGESEKVFDPATMPEDIAGLNFDSEAFFVYVLQRPPQNYVKLLFDFSKSNLFDLSDPSGTLNNSSLEVVGANETWVSGVYEILHSFLIRRRNRRAWLHLPHTYTLLIFFLVLPVSFWIVYRLHERLSPSIVHWPMVLETAFYIYVVLILILLFRILFQYVLWVFPLIEYKGQSNDTAQKHRIILATLLSSLSLALVYDVLKSLLW